VDVDVQLRVHFVAITEFGKRFDDHRAVGRPQIVHLKDMVGLGEPGRTDLLGIGHGGQCRRARRNWRNAPIFMMPPRRDVLLNRSYIGASFGARCQRLHPIGAHSVRRDIAGDRCDCDDQSVGESFDTTAKAEQ
jgi:hypothetical protein